MSDSTNTRRTSMSESLQQVTVELGRVPQMSEFVERTQWEYHDTETEFETWADAVRAAGIDYQNSLLAELENLAEAVGGVPEPEDMHQHGCYSSGIYRVEFGSWKSAVEAIEVPAASEDTRTVNQSIDGSNSPVQLSEEADSDVLTSVVSEFENLDEPRE